MASSTWMETKVAERFVDMSYLPRTKLFPDTGRVQPRGEPKMTVCFTSFETVGDFHGAHVTRPRGSRRRRRDRLLQARRRAGSRVQARAEGDRQRLRERRDCAARCRRFCVLQQ